MANTHPSDPLALYIHIPFCETKCPYCDFNTYAGIGMLIPDYVKALKQEVIFWSSALEHKRVDTLFFGGGTPSLLSLLEKIPINKAGKKVAAANPNAKATTCATNAGG